MAEWHQGRIDRAFALLVTAARKGERCPMSNPHGPLESGAIEKLISLGMIRSEVSGRNYRCVVILTGEHAGKTTLRDPTGHAVWCIDGRHVDRDRFGTHESRRTARKQQPSAPRLLKYAGSDN